MQSVPIGKRTNLVSYLNTKYVWNEKFHSRIVKKC
jgi:hypothetical protein